MTLLKKIVRFIDAINEWVGRVSAWVLVPLMLVIVFEVVTRRLLNSPTVWTFETSIQMYGFLFMIMAPYTLLHNKHISVDIIVSGLSKKTRALIDVLTYLVFFFPFAAILLKEGLYFAKESWAIREVSYTVFAPPLYPIKTIIPVMAFLLLLQGLSNFSKKVLFLMNGEEL